jgi:hypothetical protein
MVLTHEKAEFERVSSAWKIVEQRSADEARTLVGAWSADIARLDALERALRRQGRWQRGPSDFFGVLRIPFDEVRHCRMLAWLLDPLATHGLGDRFLKSFLDSLTPMTSSRESFGGDLGDVQIVSEEPREETRADIVVYGSTWAILIEAKVLAGEQGDQGRRLEERWASDQPHFIFLTRSGRAMRTGSSVWIPYRWSQLARTLRNCLEDSLPGAKGAGVAWEYLRSMEAHLR